MSAQKTLLALAAGVVVGAAAGILFAPEKGEVMRGKLKDKSGDAADKLQHKYHETKDMIKDKFQKGADEASQKVNQAAQKAKKATA